MDQRKKGLDSPLGEQGPKKSQPLYGIVGDGKVARHFAHYFTLKEIPFVSWSRKKTDPSGQTPSDALHSCTHVLLLIKDSAIEEWAQAHQELLSQKSVIHFSGALITPLAWGTHPLMSFGPELYALSDYERIPFICEASETKDFKTEFPELSNEAYSIPAEQKPLYHSLCVLGGNLSVLLWQKAFHDFRSRLDLPEKVLHPYLRQITRNLVNDSQNALTGPIAREDIQTLRKNLDALGGDAYANVLRTFIQAASPRLAKELQK